ncbi:MAG: peptidase S8/S53 domain-containing protein [Benniella sp.]|nr:MAG: peptidase S8/S53 domain-containing protein [Benniella sp.]
MKVTSLFSLVAAATLVSAGEFFPIGQLPGVDVIPGAYLVEFEDGFDYTKSGIFLNIKIGLLFDIRHQYSIFNGMSIQVKSDHVGDDLAGLEGVKNVWPVQVLQLPTPKASNQDFVQPFLVNAHKMTGVDYIHETFGNTGEGVKVGIVDSGIELSHPAFGKCPGETCRIVGGYDLVGDDYDTTGKPVEDEDPNDCFGHGTHVAGIIGADARNIGAPQPFVGVAPGVTLSAYKVTSCQGGSSSELVMMGLERAAKDKMNIINLSMGTGPNYRSNPIANTIEKLTAEYNIVVVAAVGNSGEDGIWSVSDASLGLSVTAAASFGYTATDHFHFTYSGKEYPYLPSQNWGKSLDLPSNATLVPILKDDGSLSDACTAEAYKGYDVTGKVVLTNGDQNACGHEARGTVAQTAGALGTLHRSVPSGLTEFSGIIGFPMASIEESAADKIIAAHRANNTNTIQWPSTKTPFIIEGSATPSDFSNWGLDGDLHIKPELSAPGGDILSTFPLDKGGYYVASGTSMASPYVAGAYALLFNKTGGPLSALDVRRRFINSAVPGNFVNRTMPAPVAKQGGGLINVKNTLASTTYFSTDRFPATDRIELLDSVHFPNTSTINVKITNLGKNETVYSLSHQPAESVVSYRGGNTSPLSTPILGDDQATVTFSNTTVTVPADDSVTITLQFQEPSTGLASEFPFYSGFIVATPQVGNPVPVRLPYAGVKGDVSKVPMLDTKAGYPYFVIANKTGETRRVEAGYTIDWNADQPRIYTRLGSHTPELSIRLHDEAGNFVGYFDTPNGIAATPRGRDMDFGGGDNLEFQTTDWRNGMIYTDRKATTATKASSGKYKVVVAAQGKLSQGVYPGDFEIHEVAVITIA